MAKKLTQGQARLVESQKDATKYSPLSTTRERLDLFHRVTRTSSENHEDKPEKDPDDRE